MPDDGLLKIQGAQEVNPDKFVSLAFVKMIGGLQTQRSPFQSLDNRYNTRFLGGKPDALLAGTNVEINNSLLMQRRPGLSAYGPSIDPPIDFFSWEIATTGDINLVVDTKAGVNSSNGQVLRYSQTNSGIYINKAAGAGQTNFLTIVNTLYMGDGVDLFKLVGPNLFTQSNTYNTGSGTGFAFKAPWTGLGISAMTPGQVDPNNGTAATEIQWSTSGPGAQLTQTVVPNYTPIAKNTFTFSIWMKVNSGTQTIEMRLSDQNGAISSNTFTLTTAWEKFQITGTFGSASNEIVAAIANVSSTAPTVIYGAQLEVGGPATTTQITTSQPQGVYLWGILGPSGAPTLTYQNAAGQPGFPGAWQPNTAYSLNQIIIDSNGDLELVTTAGTSGATQPVWAGLGGTTTDGISNSIVQDTSSFVQSSSVSLAFQSNVTHNNTLFAFIVGDVPNTTTTLTVTDTQSNSWSLVASTTAGDLHISLYAVVASAAAGATTVTATFSSPAAFGMWICLAEVAGLTVAETHNTNAGRNVSGSVFATGAITTTSSSAFLLSFAASENNSGPGSDIMGSPSGYQTLGSQNSVSTRSNTRWFSMAAVCEFLSSVQTINPLWSISGTPATNGIAGITAAYTTSVGTLIWTNVGKIYTLNGVTFTAGLTPTVGYIYYYAFMNSITGHVSNVSVASGSTGAANTTTGSLVGQIINVSGVGMQRTPSGPYTQDPQVDTVVVFRNTDGGAFFFQIASFANPGNASMAGTWSLADVAPDDGIAVQSTVTLNGGAPQTITEQLNNEIDAPIGFLNTPPPAGLIDFDYFAGRMWGSSGAFVFYNTAADNASLLGVSQNGVPAESWAPANEVPYNARVTRIAAVGGGLFVATILDSWFLTGQNLLTGGFNPQKILIKHGMRSYNALDLDGSSIYMYTSDHQFLCINANSGSIEFGFPIGNVLEENFSPLMAYIVRHVAGSRDNAVYLADGQSKWYRLNPNQQGASMSGEQTPVWSPLADFSQTIGGIGAVASIETVPGLIQLLVGQVVNGPVLFRNLGVFSDDGDNYAWNATIGSILLTTAGKLAETESITTEMNASLGTTQCSVGVLLEEISGPFEFLEQFVNDPPQLNPSMSVLSNRFYLSQGTVPPLVRHMQIQLTSGIINGVQQATMDELLGITIRGCLVSEQV